MDTPPVFSSLCKDGNVNLNPWHLRACRIAVPCISLWRGVALRGGVSLRRCVALRWGVAICLRASDFRSVSVRHWHLWHIHVRWQRLWGYMLRVTLCWDKRGGIQCRRRKALWYISHRRRQTVGHKGLRWDAVGHYRHLSKRQPEGWWQFLTHAIPHEHQKSS